MRPLKRRLRADNIPNDKRVMRGRAGRTLYIIFLLVFALLAGNYAFGDFILLSADGLVLKDQHVIATTYVACVDKVNVTEGQAVKEGEVLLTLQSIDMLERLADLSIKRAQLMASSTDFKVRTASVEQLMPLAERRTSEAVRTIKQFDNLVDDKLVTSARYQEALRQNYEASRDSINLVTQSTVLKQELAALQNALADANGAIKNLQDLYADGYVRSPVNGFIGASIPLVGNVYRPGEPMLSIYSGDPYVLVYLPRRYLLPIYVGMELKISDGHETADGTVTKILPVTDTLPKEFQNTFKPSDRNQLAKIKITSASQFPLNQKVSVSRFSPSFGDIWKIGDFFGLGNS